MEKGFAKMNGLVTPKPYDLEKRLELFKTLTNTVQQLDKEAEIKKRPKNVKIKLSAKMEKITVEGQMANETADYVPKYQNKPRRRHTQTVKNIIPSIDIPMVSVDERFTDISLDTDRGDLKDASTDGEVKEKIQPKKSLGYRIRSYLSKFLCCSYDFT